MKPITKEIYMPAMIWAAKFAATLVAAVVVDEAVKGAKTKWTKRKVLVPHA